MSAIATAIIASAVIGAAVSIYSTYESSHAKLPDVPALPKTPTAGDSLAAAQVAADARRRTILNAGGQTNLTNSLAPAKAATAAPKTLLG